MRKQDSFSRQWWRWSMLVAVFLISTWALAVTSGSYLSYFTSSVDVSQQAYGIYIPTSYSRFAKHPVIFIGHSFKGTVTGSFTYYQRSFANSYGFLLVQVDGRGNCFYDGVGEIDLFEVLADLQRLYTIDVDRLYFEGASMGATGAYRFGIRFPHIFAAVGGCDGFADYRAWYQQYYGPADNPGEMAPCRIPNLAMASCVDIAGRAKWQHIWMTVDTGDTSVWPVNTYNLRDTLNSLGSATAETDYQYTYDPNSGGHTAGYDQPSMYSYFRTITNNRYPKHVTLTTNRLKYGTQYWVRVDRLQTANVFAKVDAVANGNTISVSTSNVLAYSLALDANLVSTAQPVTIVTNGVVSYQGPAGVISLYAQRTGDTITGWSTNDSETNKAWKVAGLEGPIGDAFTSRFLVFYGASGTATETNRAEAQEFCDKWNTWMKAGITPHPDTDLADMVNLPNWADTVYGDSNIILFGTIESSAVLSALQAQLPVAAHDDRVVVGTKLFAGYQYGTFFVYPNPKNPQKYLVVSHGTIRVPAITQQAWASDPDASAKDLEALPWYWPDYVVFRTDIIPRATVQEKLAYLPDAFVEAGYF
ncbi:MAG TPA: hypothetical protein VHV83_13050, partial [Armatimonadota bacterium]|nr:hypothetical protein [Armatimonadota bacterium]